MTTTASGELPAGWPRLSLAQAHAALTAPGSPFELETVAIDGREMRVFKHAPPTLREVFLAGRLHGAKDFLVYRDERVSYEAFSRASITLANVLVAHGLRKGDRVAIAMRNLPEWPVALFGTLLAGGIATLLNAWWTGPELEYGLTDSGSRFAFVDGERLERLAPHRAACVALEHLWVSREAPGMLGPGVASLSELIGPSTDWAGLPVQPMPDVPLVPDDGATILYTSGTTGRSKGALGTHRNAACALMAGPFTAVRNFVRRGEPVPVPDPTAPQRCTLLSIPFFHTTGCHAVLCPTIANGAKLVLMHHWDPLEARCASSRRERVTSAGGVPTIAWQMIEHPERERIRPLVPGKRGLRRSACRAPSWCAASSEVFPTRRRASAGACRRPPPRSPVTAPRTIVHRPDSSGPALPVVRHAKVVDPDGSTNCLWVRSANCGCAGRMSSAAIGTSPRPRPPRSSMAGCAPATWRGSMTRASCSSSTA
jgi:long-chain acyl-CoA synthetase